MIDETHKLQRKIDEAHRGRKRFASLGTVVFTGVGIILVMYFIFPRPSWFRQLSPDTVTPSVDDNVRVSMIRNLLARGRGGLAMYENYARQLGVMGEYGLAFSTLDSLFPNLPADSAASLRKLEAELAMRAIYYQPSPEVEALARRHLQNALESFLTLPAPQPVMIWAAKTARQAGRDDIATRLYLEMGRRDPAQTALWYEEAVRVAISNGDYFLAADLYFQLQRMTRDRDRQKMFFLQGLRTLQSGDQLDSALAKADRELPEWLDDSDVLLFLVKLARAANRSKEANRYARILIQPASVRSKAP